jgi:hypothetical protein
MRYITPTTTVLVVAALAGAGTAAADVHIDPSGYGGRPVQQLAMRAAVASTASAPAVRLGGESKQHQPVVASISKGRKRVRLNLAYDSQCTSGDGPMFSIVDLAPANIRKARYSVSRTITDPFGDGYTLVESYVTRGRLVKTRLTGVVRIKDTLYAENGSVVNACDSGRVRFAAQRSGVLAGTTDEGDPVVLTYTASHDRVKSLMIPWAAECDSGNWIWGTTHLSDTVRQGGAFGGTWSKAVASANDETMTSTYTLGGVLFSHSAFGSWRVSASLTDSAQNVVDSCDNYGLDFQVK